MGRTFTTLATGNAEADGANVVQLHLKNRALESRVAELEAQNRSLKQFIQRLTASGEQPNPSDKETQK